jgi:hypothetical protein
MRTTLNSKAHWVPALLFFAPIIFWIMMASMNNSSAAQVNYSSYLLLCLLVCWGGIAFTLFFDYQEYSFDSQNLTIKNLVTKKQIVIPFKSITNLKLHEKSIKNGHYHNIIVETRNGEHTLRGVYVNEMTHFFYELEKVVKQ